jgi:hypothetical protein
LKRSVLQIPKEALGNALAEGGTEAVQGLTQNLISKFSDFSEGKDITEGLVDQFLAGFATGGFLGAGVSTVSQVTPQDYTERIEEVSTNVKEKLGEEFTAGVDEIMAKVDTETAVGSVISSFEGGDINEVVNNIKNLSGKELAKIENVVTESYKKADEEQKKELDTIKEAIEENRREELIAQDKVPTFIPDKKLEEDNEFIESKVAEIDEKVAKVEEVSLKTMTDLDKQKQTLLTQKK